MENHTHIHINGNHNIVNVNQSNTVSGIGGGSSGCGCLSGIFLIFFIGCIAPLCNTTYKPSDNQKWFEPVHGSHTNQINYRKSCQLCKDELCDDILEEHIKPDLDLGRIHWSDSTKEKCPICKFNLILSKTEIKKIYSESQKSIQYIPIFFEEYPMIDNDILPHGSKSVNWINKTKSIKALVVGSNPTQPIFKSYLRK
jgi:hypothetical protein